MNPDDLFPENILNNINDAVMHHLSLQSELLSIYTNVSEEFKDMIRTTSEPPVHIHESEMGLFYKLLRKGLLSEEILKITITYFETKHSVSTDTLAPVLIMLQNKDTSNGKEYILDNFTLDKLFDDELKSTDLLIVENSIFLAKSIVNIITHSIGIANFCRIIFKEAAYDEHGSIVEEEESVHIMLRGGIGEFKEALEKVGRYDLLLNL